MACQGDVHWIVEYRGGLFDFSATFEIRLKLYVSFQGDFHGSAQVVYIVCSFYVINEDYVILKKLKFVSLDQCWRYDNSGGLDRCVRKYLILQPV